MSNSTVICPLPLATATNGDQYYTWYVYEDCVVPCPTIEYTTSEWNDAQYFLTVLSIISLVLSFFSFIGHLRDVKRFYIQIMFIGGFFLQALVTVVFLIANENNEVVCSGNAHFIERGHLCVFQATSIIFLFIWVETWSVVFVYDLYLHLTSQLTKADIPRTRVWYTVVAAALSTGVTAFPLGYANVGFDPEANIPFCLFMISETSTLFWFTFFLPMCLLILVAAVVAIMVALKMHQIFVNSAAGDVIGGGSNLHLAVDDHPTSRTESSIAMGNRSIRGEDSSRSLQADLPEDAARGSRQEEDGHSPEAQGASSGAGARSLGEKQDSHRHRGASDLSDAEYGGEFSTDRGYLRRPFRDISDSSVLGDTGANAATPAAVSTNPLLQGLPYRKSGNMQSAPPGGEITQPQQEGVLDDASTSSVGASSSRRMTTSSAAWSKLARMGSPSLVPPLWQQFMHRTWKYNGLTIVFVVTFCFTTLMVAPMIFQLFYVTWGATVNAGEDYVECLMRASVQSQSDNVPQTLDAVTEYAQAQCGGDVPADRPNSVMLLIVLVWSCSYGIIPSLIFGFGGLDKKLTLWLKSRLRGFYGTGSEG